MMYVTHACLQIFSAVNDFTRAVEIYSFFLLAHDGPPMGFLNPKARVQVPCKDIVL